MTDNLSDEPLLAPPSPRGDPILGPSDNSLLGNFFNGLETSEYCPWPYGESVNFNEQWMPQVAPNLLGHSTSFGPQPPSDLASTSITGVPLNFQDVFAFEQSIMPPPPPPSLPIRPSLPSIPQPQAPQSQSQPTIHQLNQSLHQPFHDQRSFYTPVEHDAHADVAAVLTTLHAAHSNTYTPRTNCLSGFHPSPSMQASRDHRNSLSHSSPAQSRNGPIRPTRSNETDTLFTDMMFGSRGPTTQRPAEPPALQWGSDTLFARSNGFVPPQHESIEALERKRLNAMREALKLSNSTPNTRPSSPVANREAATHLAPEAPNGSMKMEEDAAIPPKRRRKSKAKVEGDEDGEPAEQLPSKAPARKRKSKGDLNVSSDSSFAIQEASGKRRKSAASQPKPPRENLTDAQKRENHIKSEQKRRGAIKEGFDDLTFIVPNLQNGGYSKSSMLNMAGEWLESLIKGNQLLDPEGTHAP
ncbi:hypothetical protein F4802DRAFT_609603 [Xylaria palmicola]|nr:hypothetical protein F4802DRAFT_609603 [Xylaria palmicola]